MSIDTQGVKCRVRSSLNYGDPLDCSWPFCGCDDRAEKVVQSLQECGWEDGFVLRAALQTARRQLVTLGGDGSGESGDSVQAAVIREIDRALGETDDAEASKV